MSAITKVQWWKIHIKAWMIWRSHKQTLNRTQRVVLTPFILPLLLTPGCYYHHQYKAGVVMKRKPKLTTPILGMVAFAGFGILLLMGQWIFSGLLLLVAMSFLPTAGTYREARSTNADYVASDFFAIPGRWQAGTTLINNLKNDHPKTAVALNPKGVASRERYYQLLGAKRQPNGFWVFHT